MNRVSSHNSNKLKGKIITLPVVME